ncbi:MAG TPA: SOS response-associated peptidase [Polyangiaceae bacterium]|nr:SOS response-associated peptidase [Polyangiaceae bacterium]
MCGRVTETDATRIFEELSITGRSPALEMPARYNIPPSESVPVVRVLVPDSGRRLDLLRWGLVPFWAKDATIGNRLINARVETIADKPAYKEPFQRRRCLVVVDGFYEWQRQGKTKQPFHLQSERGELLAMAGLWDSWLSPDGELIESFAIITKPAEPVIADIHDRMPAILNRENFDEWLSPGPHDAATLLALLGRPSPPLVAVSVSARVNKPDYDHADCIEPVTPAQKGLFD